MAAKKAKKADNNIVSSKNAAVKAKPKKEAKKPVVEQPPVVEETVSEEVAIETLTVDDSPKSISFKTFVDRVAKSINKSSFPKNKFVS